MTLEFDALIQIQKCWDVIRYELCQSLPTNKSWPPYKKPKAENYSITSFFLPQEKHSKYTTAKENFEALSGALRLYIVKDTTISSSKAPKSHVNLVTYIHYKNICELLIAFFLAMSPQLGGLGPKYYDLLILFRLGEGGPTSDFQLRDLAIRSEIVFMIDQTGHINNITGKYTRKLSNMKHLQQFMNSFEL